ncbi:MAG TPA: cyanophycinase, partial [Candidatus Thermoplasmatota archaeon]|nr:cyanophycinase [Candidatus Thermoplasmatota archaeon]
MPEGRTKPKGSLVAVGGNEDKEKDLKVLRIIAGLPEGGTKTVEVIPTASEIPKEVSQLYIQAFSKIGIGNVHVMDIQDRHQARDPDFVRRIRECDVVFLTGGDQLRLTSLLGGSPVLEAIRDHYWNGGVVAGTSAGAAAMSGTMIFEGEAEKSMKKGNVQMVPGLGLIRIATIDTHFIQRGRVSRLLEVVASNPGLIGLGLGEDTGIIIRDGDRVEVIGTGVVVVVDGHDIRYSNITAIRLGQPIAVEHMVVHTLVEGAKYDLREQRY